MLQETGQGFILHFFDAVCFCDSGITVLLFSVPCDGRNTVFMYLLTAYLLHVL